VHQQTISGRRHWRATKIELRVCLHLVRDTTLTVGGGQTEIVPRNRSTLIGGTAAHSTLGPGEGYLSPLTAEGPCGIGPPDVLDHAFRYEIRAAARTGEQCRPSLAVFRRP